MVLEEAIVKIVQKLKLRMQGTGLALRTSRRRGSFLVLVVGTLAMLSIIMIVYVAVGSADKRTSSSIARRDRSEEIVSLFADYAAQIIADDAVTMVPDASNGQPNAINGLDVFNVAGRNLFLREAWDSPSTNWIANSALAQSTEVTGLAGQRYADPRVFRAVGFGDDPWLASTTPTWLNYAPSATAPNALANEKIFTKRRDWLHISNIAPDGRFINLYSLKDNFDAKPGTSNVSTDRRMNADLTLLDASSAPTLQTAWNQNAVPDQPAFFDSWQVNAFRPAKGPFKDGGTDILQSRPQFYPPYQWADADGDGFFDSRWFEMVDARGDANASLPSRFRSLLPSDPNFRWIFAARIVDLSALVNVNAVGDMNADPNVASTPASTMPRKMDVVGLSPADIDLKRLLQMRDFSETVFDQPGLTPPQPITISDVLINGNPFPRPYNGGYSAFRQPANGFPAAQDYTKHVDNLSRAGIAPIAGFPAVTMPAADLGLGTYRALRGSLGSGGPTGRFSNFIAPPLDTQAIPFASIRDRSTFYNEIAAPAGRAIYDSTLQRFAFGTGFGIDNLVELLTFRATNDSRVTTSLELVLGGHFNSSMSVAPTPTDPQNTFGTLRENRATELERESLAFPDGRPTEAAMLKSYTDLRQYLTTHSGARPIIPALNLNSAFTGSNLDLPPDLSATSDIATYIGDNNATTSLDGNALFKGYAAALAPGLGLTGAWKKPDPGSDARSLRGLFYGHQGPLTALLAAGHMAANFASSGQSSTSTSKHLPYTLVLTEDVYQNANNKLPDDINYTAAPGTGYTGWQKFFPGWWIGKQYQLNVGRTPPLVGTTPRTGALKLSENATIDPVPAPAVNLYGMGDAHPFLVEVASFTVYRDTYPGSGPKVDKTDLEALTYNPTQTLPPTVTINGDIVNQDNPDFLFRAIAVKLNNPYAQPIRLSSDFAATTKYSTTSGAQFATNVLDESTYLRIGAGTNAKYYLLADVEETKASGSNHFDGEYTVAPAIMQPGETIVFYALNRDAKAIVEDRFNLTDQFLNISDVKDATEFENWLTTQLGPKTATSFRRIKMLRADATTFGDIGSTPPQAPASFVNDTLVPDWDGAGTNADQTVMLWRAVRTNSGTSAGGADDRVASSPNSVLNDQLCDRLRLGTAFNLDWRMDGGAVYNTWKAAYSLSGMWIDPAAPQNAFSATRTFRWNSVDYTGTHDSRFSITFGVNVGRKGDSGGGTLYPGQIPAWAIDPKDAPADTWYEKASFPPQPPGARSVKKNMPLSEMDAGNANRVFSAYRPQDWRTLPAMFPTLPLRADAMATQIDDNKEGKKLADIRRELARNGNQYQGLQPDGTTGYSPDGVSQIRQTDLLHVMGVGPSHAPVDVTGNPILDASGNPDLSRQWTTMAEALAIGLGYSTPPATETTWQSAGSVYGPLDYYYFEHPTTGTPRSLFDSGYLRTDAFIAGRYDPSDDTKFYPSSTGAPIAGNVLSTLKVRSDSYASLSMPIAGLVNINTAPQPVLRVLPFTFPSKDEISNKTFWIGSNDATRETEARKTDIAAMIESYRDKIAVPLRPDARGTAAPKTWFAPFMDRTDATLTSLIKPNDPTIGDPNQTTPVGGRYWSSGIKGIREGAGFNSPAELFGVRAVTFTPATGEVMSDGDSPSNIDFMAYRTAATNLLGVDNIVEQVLDVADPAAPKVTDIKPLQFGKTYQDKLRILSGLLGSITVRSDMYAVWFVARGYQRSDVEGLPALQPMVPSVERRFLMIIDRSNVTKVGQKPRVLAFVELPL
jgi:hypothetical protein